jgi:gliding motility-associated-like protein
VGISEKKTYPTMTINKHLYLLFLIIIVSNLNAQETCTGNLGINIFEDGDFGSGIPNILPNDPGIAPGYLYSTNPPPNDGFYTITNNTGVWPLFPTWLSVMDNSPDPNGYMMVVNASFETGAFYDREITGLCENTLYEFSADIYNLIQPSVVGHILPNVSFLLNDVIQYTTGNIPQTDSWITYGFTFSTGPGETSVRLTLRNNAPGGIGNDLCLDNISFRACGPQALILPLEIENICEDGSPIPLFATIIGDQYTDPAIQWQESFDGGTTWQNIAGATDTSIMHTNLSAGFYYYRYLLANTTDNLQNDKCRVISNIKVVFVQPKLYTLVDTICDGNSFSVGNSEYTLTGLYTDSLISSIGCDSIVMLDLTVVPDLNIAADLTAFPPLCPGFEDGSILVDNVNNAYPPYTVFFEEETDNGPASLFEGLGSGSYSVSIVDHFGCTFEGSTTVPDASSFIIELGPDQTLNLGEGIQLPLLTTNPVSNIVWEPEEGIICETDCLAPFILPTQTTTYSLTLSTEAGCTVADSVTITVIEVRQVYIPTAFSPNDDGRNDTFTIFANTPNVDRITSLQIFNRWGGLVFENNDFLPNDISVGWDGRWKGEQLGSDVFTYVAIIRFLDGREISYMGDIQLVR